MRTTISSTSRPISYSPGLSVVMLLLSATAAFCLDVDMVLKALQDPNPGARRSALESRQLAVCYSSDADEKNCPLNPEEDRKLIAAFKGLLTDPDPGVRRMAAQYLVVSTDAGAVKALGPLLRDVDEDVREMATRGYVHFRVTDPAIVGDLERLLKDTNKNVRKNAAMALAFNGTRRSLELMREAYSREADTDVKKLFAEALKELEKKRR